MQTVNSFGFFLENFNSDEFKHLSENRVVKAMNAGLLAKLAAPQEALYAINADLVNLAIAESVYLDSEGTTRLSAEDVNIALNDESSELCDKNIVSNSGEITITRDQINMVNCLYHCYTQVNRRRVYLHCFDMPAPPLKGSIVIHAYKTLFNEHPFVDDSAQEAFDFQDQVNAVSDKIKDLVPMQRALIYHALIAGYAPACKRMRTLARFVANRELILNDYPMVFFISNDENIIKRNECRSDHTEYNDFFSMDITRRSIDYSVRKYVSNYLINAFDVYDTVINEYNGNMLKQITFVN
jgi:hypothetical protein